MADQELKPCPFCGGQAKYNILENYNSADGHSVFCDLCRVETDECSSQQEAAELWNRRA